MAVFFTGVPSACRGLFCLGGTLLFQWLAGPRLNVQYTVKQPVVRGFGTLDEMFEAPTLIQAGTVQHFPIILFGSAFWRGRVDSMRERLVEEAKIAPGDLELFTVTDSAEEACRRIVGCYRNRSWLSSKEAKAAPGPEAQPT
jgi:hypothetical protein